MRTDIAVRGHDLAYYDDITALSSAMRQRGLHSLAFSPAKSLPQTTHEGDLVSFGLGAFVRRALADSEVEIATLSCYVNMVAQDLTEQDKTNGRLARYLQIAPAFGTRIVATETGSVSHTYAVTPANYEDKVFETLVRQVRRLLKVAHASGTFLALEPGISNPLYSLGRVKELVQAVNDDANLKLIIDPVNLLQTAADSESAILDAAFSQFADRIVAVHLKDYRWHSDRNHKIETVVPGQGQGNVPEMLRLADKAQPFGIKCLDELPDGMLDRALALPWIKNV